MWCTSFKIARWTSRNNTLLQTPARQRDQTMVVHTRAEIMTFIFICNDFLALIDYLICVGDVKYPNRRAVWSAQNVSPYVGISSVAISMFSSTYTITSNMTQQLRNRFVLQYSLPSVESIPLKQCLLPAKTQRAPLNNSGPFIRKSLRLTLLELRYTRLNFNS